MFQARDEVYCHLVARRAVARAALHLGLESLTSEALHVLGDVLLEYLARIGRTLGHGVEASGRSSAHVHVLDAIRATELCTAPAVTRVHPAEQVDPESANSSSNDPADASWKGLAAFLFGPDWYQEDAHRDGEAGDQPATAADEGKLGPSSSKSKPGWNAPYPEELPAFPVAASSRIANPHPLSRELAWDSLHTVTIERPSSAKEEDKDKKKKPQEAATAATEEEVSKQAAAISSIPDEVFQSTTWGALTDDTAKRKREPDNNASSDVGDGRPKKRTKTTKETTTKATEPTNEGLFLPRCYPPLPKAEDGYQVVAVDGPATRDASSTDLHLVRSSLVQLDDVWGKIAPEGPTVKAGAAAELAAVPQIVPLGRASGSRVSRILEGSMDVAALP